MCFQGSAWVTVAFIHRVPPSHGASSPAPPTSSDTLVLRRGRTFPPNDNCHLDVSLEAGGRCDADQDAAEIGDATRADVVLESSQVLQADVRKIPELHGSVRARLAGFAQVTASGVDHEAGRPVAGVSLHASAEAESACLGQTRGGPQLVANRHVEMRRAQRGIHPIALEHERVRRLARLVYHAHLHSPRRVERTARVEAADAGRAARGETQADAARKLAPRGLLHRADRHDFESHGLASCACAKSPAL